MGATETSAGSAFSVAKRNTEVQIVSLRRCESVKYLRARLEADLMQDWAENEEDGNEPVVPPFAVVGDNVGEWSFVKNKGFYRGQWKDNLAHGLGTRQHGGEGWEYCGLWMAGVFAGKGVISKVEGGSEVYAGDWAGGQRSGFGVEEAADHTFVGTWTDGFRGRFGALSCHDFSYVGTFHASNPHGVGKETEPHGGVYMGQFQVGKRHGSGVWIDAVDKGPRSAKFEGEWAYDAKEGHGTMRFLSGLVYKGGWSRNARSGFGVLLGPDGRVRKSGRWENDELAQSKDPGSSKVDEAVATATKAASNAREQSLVASQTARVAAEKVDIAEVAAQEARTMADRAREEWGVYKLVKDQPKVEADALVSEPDEDDLAAEPFDHPDEVIAERLGSGVRRRRRARIKSPLSTADDDDGEGSGISTWQWIILIIVLLFIFAFSEDLFSV